MRSCQPHNRESNPVFGTNVQAFCTEYQLKGMLLPVMLVNGDHTLPARVAVTLGFGAVTYE